MMCRYVTEREILDAGKFSRTTLRRWIAAGKFPKPQVFGPRCVRFDAQIVEAWFKSRDTGSCEPNTHLQEGLRVYWEKEKAVTATNGDGLKNQLGVDYGQADNTTKAKIPI